MPSPKDLKSTLEKLELILAKQWKSLHSDLRAGAADEDLETLRTLAPCSDGVPPELAVLWSWHDGQKTGRSLNTEDNRSLLSIEDAIETWQFLEDEAEVPWDARWIPLLTNGAGDYLMYSTVPETRGALIGYWHDDDDREVEYDDLLLWAQEVLDGRSQGKEEPAQPVDSLPIADLCLAVQVLKPGKPSIMKLRNFPGIGVSQILAKLQVPQTDVHVTNLSKVGYSWDRVSAIDTILRLGALFEEEGLEPVLRVWNRRDREKKDLGLSWDDLERLKSQD